MKVGLLLLFISYASAQDDISAVFRQAIGNFARQFRPGQSTRPTSFQSRPNRFPNRQPGRFPVRQTAGNNNVDAVFNGKNYNFSWKHTGSKWDWNGAVAYCSNLGSGWEIISISSRAEDKFADDAIEGGGQKYIWTSLNRVRGGGWQYFRENPGYIDWSPTGGYRRPQPDNREADSGGPQESCGSILNKFYPRDLVTMHDVACYHVKPTICEFQG